MPRVSILLTCYNHLPYLKQAVESIRAQTYTDYEVLALDDGSSDGSREWLIENCSDFQLHFQPKNLGTYGNLNFGIERATGEYFAVFNDDDLWANEKLARQVARMDENPRAGLCHCGGWFIDENNVEIKGEPLGFPYPSTQSGEVFASLIEFNKVITSSALFSRKAVDRVGMFDASFYGCGDWHMWLKIAEHFEVEYIPEPLCFYRVHATNAFRNEVAMNQDSHRIREWIASQTPRLLQRPELRSALNHNMACLGTERMWSGDLPGGRRAYWESLKMNPLRFKSLVRLLASFLPKRAFRNLR